MPETKDSAFRSLLKNMSRRSRTKKFDLLNNVFTPRPEDRVLDVGCATGYSAAVLALMAKAVVAVEQDEALARAASDELTAVGAENTTVVRNPLAEGAKVLAPYDVIVIEGAVEEAPQTLLSQLAEGGRLVAIVQQGAQGRAQLFVQEKGQIGSRQDFDASVPILAGFHKSVGFVF